MAVQLTTGKKKVPAAPKTVSGSLYGYANQYTPYKAPAVVKPKTPALFTPGMSDADYEARLMGGGAWGSYTPETVARIDQPVVQQGFGTQIAKKQRPNFKSYVAEGIPGDWEVQDAEAAFGSRMASLRSALTGDIRNALVNLGLPENADVSREFGGYIDQDTITKAVQNKYSTAAQIAEQERVQRKQSNAALAARGMLQSGWTTNNAAQIAAEGEKGRYAAVQDFLTGARGGLRGLGDAEAGLQGQVATARQNAANRLAQQYGYEFPEETPTTPESGITDTDDGGYNPGPVTPAAKPAAPKETAAQKRARLAAEALRRRSIAANKYYGLPK